VRLPIRWRLTLWNVAAFAVVLACFAALVHALVHRAFLDQADRLLAASLDLLRDDPRAEADPAGRIAFWVEEYDEHQGLDSVVYRAVGPVVARTPGLETPAPPEAGSAVVDWPGAGRRRSLAARLRLGGEEYTVVLLAPLDAADRELALLRSVFLTAGPFALALCGAFGYWLARRALAPVDHLRREADAVTAERLDRRVAVADPDDEIGRLAGTVNALLERLERAFAETRRFTADASHELRTPLTVLRTAVEVALSRPRAADEDRDLLGSLLEELGRMSRLTDQLLDLSRRDAGVDHFAATPVDLPALLAGVVDALRPLAEAKGVRLEMTADAVPPVAGEAGRLRQVFINLLDNAIKFTPAGGLVVVRLTGEAGRVIVAVADTGPGIPAEHLPRVFDRFYRVDKSRSRAEGGTGLGLSIARSLVQAHGGTIAADNAPGGGAVFEVALPVSRPAAP